MVGLLSRISFFSLIKSRGSSRTWKFITRKIAAPRSSYLDIKDVKAATELINRTLFSDLIFIVPRGTIVGLTGLRGISVRHIRRYLHKRHYVSSFHNPSSSSFYLRFSFPLISLNIWFLRLIFRLSVSPFIFLFDLRSVRFSIRSMSERLSFYIFPSNRRVLRFLIPKLKNEKIFEWYLSFYSAWNRFTCIRFDSIRTREQDTRYLFEIDLAFCTMAVEKITL